MEESGLITVESRQDVAATASRFIAAAKQAGLTIFGQRDNSKDAHGPNQPKPAILVLFGNPNVIARLTAANPEIGIDLPMKALVWQAADGKVRISYNHPHWLFNRHGLSEQFSDVASRMAAVLDSLIKAACSPPD